MQKSLFQVILILTVFGCGKTAMVSSNLSQSVDSRSAIIGGSASRDSLSRSVAQVLRNDSDGSYNCTGVMIQSNVVLTAAHCVFFERRVAGARDFSVELNGSSYRVLRIFAHPGFSISNPVQGNDLALLQLNQKIASAKPVALPEGTWWTAETPVIAAGFGTDRSGRENERLRKVDVKISRRPDALAALFDLESPLTVFAIENTDRGICSGDSGGPALAVNPRTSQTEVIGIASGVTEQKNKSCFGLGFYTHLGMKIDWIKSTLQRM